METSAAPEGVLVFDPHVEELQSISPTRYVSIRNCALREVWAANGAPALLPLSPAARLGTVIHRLLEEAGEGAFYAQNRDSIDARWEQLVATAEAEMLISWRERHLVPLRGSVPDFEVRHIQATQRAEQLSRTARHSATPHAAADGGLLHGCEVPVSWKGGAVKGRIDEVTISGSGPVVRDYKSGSIFERRPEHSHVLREAYEIQLRMYAALYAATTGTWPVRLEVVPVLGHSQQVEFDRDSCERLLSDASRTLSSINESISAAESADALQAALARPRPESCIYCPYRPGCSPYSAAAYLDPLCPGDVSGKLLDIEQLAGGSYLMTVQDGDDVIRIRKLAGESRHPALALLTPGDRVAIYGLRTTESPLTFVESRFTTIFQVPENSGSRRQEPQKFHR